MMTAPKKDSTLTVSDPELIRRIRNDLIDSFDEELEMGFEDRTIDELVGNGQAGQGALSKTWMIAAGIFASCFGYRANSSNCNPG